MDHIWSGKDGIKRVLRGYIPVLKRLAISSTLFLALFNFQAIVQNNYLCGQHLVFSDNFDAPAINDKVWNTSYPSGKEELQYYSPNAFSFKNGWLIITANNNGGSDDQKYTSGIITTQGKFQPTYGYFEIRAKIPHGQGLFPAFWLLPASGKWPPELDVFEFLGQNPYTVHMSSHWSDTSGNLRNQTQSHNGPDYSNGFNTYAIDWEPDKITWYVNGIERYSTTEGVPHEPMFLLIDLAVGGVWAGPPNNKTQFPSYLAVDYVKVYQESCKFFTANRLGSFVEDGFDGFATY